jgi:3-methylfumaryl-CoA hydratase
MGDWLTQSVIEWLGDDGMLASIEYSNRRASYIGEILRSGGEIISLDQESGSAELKLHIKNEADEVITPGVAIVRFSAP